MEIKSRFDKPAQVAVKCEDESRTKQSFAKEADINTIMARYRKTGLLVDPAALNSSRQAVYGDFSDGTDFQEFQNRIAAVQSAFGCLSASMRSRFKNDPAVLLDFIADPANAAEALELGLITKAESETLARSAATEPPAVPVEAEPKEEAE